jgi:hypothetical protein
MTKAVAEKTVVFQSETTTLTGQVLKCFTPRDTSFMSEMVIINKTSVHHIYTMYIFFKLIVEPGFSHKNHVSGHQCIRGTHVHSRKS